MHHITTAASQPEVSAPAVWAAMSAIAAIAVAFGIAVYKATPWLRRIGHFLDDWNGEEDRPGHPGRPGLMARVAGLERGQSVIVEAVGELQPNHGGSLNDAIRRIEEDTAKTVGRTVLPQVATI